MSERKQFSEYNTIQKVSFAVGTIIAVAVMLLIAALLIGLLWRAIETVWRIL